MANLSPNEQMVLKALQNLSARDESKMRTAEEVGQKCDRPKGQVSAALLTLVQKGLVKRRAREKSAGYYLLRNA